MRAMSLTFVALVVCLAAVPCPAQPPTSQLVLGKWKPLDTKDDAILEFLKDGKVRIVAKEIAIDGSYNFTDDSTMEVKFLIMGKESTMKFKVTIANDTLTTQEVGKDRTERFQRVK
jgi:uncharacterized protein (TIGR03066 family)